MEGTIGEIKVFAGNYAPANWAFCEGQVLAIADHQNLYSVVGAAYGGNGVATFALPDLRGRVVVGTGTGVGLTPVMLGEAGGAETVALQTAQLPAHTHEATFTQSSGTSSMPASSSAGNTDDPAGHVLAQPGSGTPNIYSDAAADSHLQAGTTAVEGTVAVSNTGSGAAHLNMQPFLGIHWIICISGAYPQRTQN